MFENPCKPDCPKRTPTCHAECPEYLAFDLLNSIMRDKKREENERKKNLYQCTRFYRDKRKKRPYQDRRHSH